MSGADFIQVVGSHPDKNAVDRELRKLDPRLFLDAEWDPDFRCLVWCVKHHLGAGQEPMLITDWRDPDTRRPLDLSWALWSKIKARENRDPFTLRDEMKAENERLRQMRREHTQEAYEALTEDMLPRMLGKRSAAVPRRQALRHSRDRARARGRNV